MALQFLRENHKALANLHAQYDWTTGVLDNRNEWRKFRAIPRLYPLRSLVCALFNKGGSIRAFRLPGAGEDHFHCTVEPSPGHIRCRKTRFRKPNLAAPWGQLNWTGPTANSCKVCPLEPCSMSCRQELEGYQHLSILRWPAPTRESFTLIVLAN